VHNFAALASNHKKETKLPENLKKKEIIFLKKHKQVDFANDSDSNYSTDKEM
jgi:hypothetical protein